MGDRDGLRDYLRHLGAVELDEHPAEDGAELVWVIEWTDRHGSRHANTGPSCRSALSAAVHEAETLVPPRSP